MDLKNIKVGPVDVAYRRRPAVLMGAHSNVDVSKIPLKPMVAAGRGENQAEPPVVRKLASLISGAELKTIPTAGHTALLEYPDMYALLARKIRDVQAKD